MTGTDPWTRVWKISMPVCRLGESRNTVAVIWTIASSKTYGDVYRHLKFDMLRHTRFYCQMAKCTKQPGVSACFVRIMHRTSEFIDRKHGIVLVSQAMFLTGTEKFLATSFG